MSACDAPPQVAAERGVRALARLAAALCVLGIVHLAALSLAAAPARAAILPAETIDGPSQEIVSFGGAAMAEDGTGGVVYIKRSGGVPHVFVSQFVGGRWLAPIRVDTEEPFAASWPRIGAADGGELIVTWATEYAINPLNEKPRYEMLGAVLGPGGSSFGQAIIVDRDIEEATGTDPDLAVSSTGQADLVYRVTEPERQSVVTLQPGDAAATVRVAHFTGLRWSALGSINRNTGIAMPAADAANAPRIAIGPTGNAVVVWQEREINGIARLFARRLFGPAVDYAMPVSAASVDGGAITDPAEAPAIALSKLGQAEVAYRQSAGSSSPLPGPRIFLNTLPDGESVSGAEFEGAKVLDEAVSGGKAAVVGAPSVDVDERRDVQVVYDADGQPRLIEGTDKGIGAPIALEPPFAGAETAAVSVQDPEGGGLAAWPSTSHGAPAVGVLDSFPDGATQTGLLDGGNGGEIAELSVGRSGLGDGIVAFRQGSTGDAAIVAAVVSEPPQLVPFVLTAPKVWVRPSGAKLTWVAPPSADPPLTYHLLLDGHVQSPAIPESTVSARLPTAGLPTGTYAVQVLASDRYGNDTLTAPAQLKLASTPPSVVLAKIGHGRGVRVTIEDPAGLNRSTLRIAFGDGSSAAGKAKASHVYAHGGIYRITVSAGDLYGDSGTSSRLVSVK